MMQAVILAGGKGTRLRPYTMNFPKPLVPLGDQPILAIIITQLAASGFSQITLLTGHLGELIEAYFGSGKKWGVKINYVREARPLDTAGALKLLLTEEDNFLVMNGDVLTDMDYEHFFKSHIEKKVIASIATNKRLQKSDFGIISITPDGMLEKYEEKPIFEMNASMGIYALSRKCIAYIGEDESIGMPDLLRRMQNAGEKIFCHCNKNYWLDIGRVDDYECAQAEFENHRERLLGAKKWIEY